MVFGDIHASDKAPSSCTESYLEDLLDLLDQTVALALVLNVAAVIWAGDVFHIKAPNRSSHRLVQRLISIVKKYPCPVFIVPGNHDIRNDRLATIHETQPLGVLFQAGARLLSGWAGQELLLYGVPWQQDWGNLSAQLSPYRHPSAQYKQPALVVAHAPLYPPGKELTFENYPSADWAKYMGGQGYCYYGHVHEPHGVWKTGGVTFCNNGALSRGSLHEYNLTRQVGVTLWDAQTLEFEFIELAAKPASEVFRLTEKAKVTDMKDRLAEFLDGIQQTSLAAVSTETVIEHAKQRGLAADELSLVEELLVEASHARK